MESPFPGTKKPPPKARVKNSGARTRTKTPGAFLNSACAGPEGMSRLRRIIERSSMESPFPGTKNPRQRQGLRIVVPGLGIEPRTRGFSIPFKSAYELLSSAYVKDRFIGLPYQKNVLTGASFHNRLQSNQIKPTRILPCKR